MGNFYETMMESDTMDKWYKCDDCGIRPATDTYGDESGALYYVCETCYSLEMDDTDYSDKCARCDGWDDADLPPESGKCDNCR